MTAINKNYIKLSEFRFIPDTIIYYFWFNKNCFNELFKLLEEVIDYSKIKIKKFNEEEYGLLYIGETKIGYKRLIEWHILDSQNLHEKGVINKTLSSLRQTLCGLLELEMSKSREKITNFFLKNCIIEYEECEKDKLKEIEKEKIKSFYLPLNYQHTSKNLTKRHREILSDSKNKQRK